MSIFKHTDISGYENTTDVLDNIYCEKYKLLYGLNPVVLDEVSKENLSVQDDIKTGRIITCNNREFFKACIADKQGNIPISFVFNGNIDIDLIINILANFSSKICEEYNGYDLANLKNIYVEYTDVSTILDYYKELFCKLEEYYLNIESSKRLGQLYENFYIMTNCSLATHKKIDIESLMSFRQYIQKNLKFFTDCRKYILDKYEIDGKGQLKHTKY